MKRAFTLLEIICAVALVAIVTTLSLATYSAISKGWAVSTDYLDKMQRTDYALNQVVSALRSMYYPHNGEQDFNYGFSLTDNGDGDDVRNSDVIEFAKTGATIVGNKSAVADTVHRIRIMMLEEGDGDFRDSRGNRIPIEVTGLYARLCPDGVLRPKQNENEKEIDYSFENEEMYAPVLISDGIVGFDCKVMATDEKKSGKADEKLFEDEYDKSNAVPYKVQLTFQVADPEGKSYRSNTAPVIRIVRLPLYEQASDGAATPGDENDKVKKSGGRRGPAGGGATRGGTPPGVGGGGALRGGAPRGGGAPGGGPR